MADPSPLNPVTPVAPAPKHHARASYHNAAEVGFHARVMEFSDSPEFRRAVDRLDRVLRSGQPLRSDVPRGYYLNVQV